MVIEAGFIRNFTGHSGKVTTATTLYQIGVDEQLIKERTGHRSDAIRSYKRTGSDQQCMLSKIFDASLISESLYAMSSNGENTKASASLGAPPTVGDV